MASTEKEGNPWENHYIWHEIFKMLYCVLTI